MGLEKYKNCKNPYGRYVYSKEIDDYFIDNYEFEYNTNGFGYGFSLEGSFKLDNSNYLWVVMSDYIIYFYEEYDCGGEIWSKEVELDDICISIEKLEEIINKYLN